MYTKSCLFCDLKIHPRDITCKTHVNLIRYKDELWFKELIKSQNRQDYIDRKEIYSINILYTKGKVHTLQTKRLDRALVIELKKTMKIKEIAAQFNVSENTIKSCLYDKRRRKI